MAEILSTNLFGTQISSGITTGGFDNSEIPCAYMNSIRGNFMIFQDAYEMLNCFQNYRVVGMLVKCIGAGPRNETENSYYELQSGGELVGPENIIDKNLDETLTIYDKEVNLLTYANESFKNSDDGTFWVKKEYCSCNNSGGGGGGGAIVEEKPILPYYFGCTLGAATKLTALEILSLETLNDNQIRDNYNITNNYGAVAIPYLALPLSFTNNKYIKLWTVGGFQSAITERYVIKVNGVFYGLYRVSGTLIELQVVNIINLILEDDPIMFLDNKIPFEFPTPTTGKFGFLYDADEFLINFEEFVDT